ncbi:putative replication regulatory protein repA2 [Klebsiella pneumoniae Kb140]|nr:putative replication regulatory protein repA2 [Klebsiella pneumoniae Kb140]
MRRQRCHRSLTELLPHRNVPTEKGTHLALLINSDLQWQRKGPPIKKLKCFWNHSSKKY